jgi:hypothetical protein
MTLTRRTFVASGGAATAILGTGYAAKASAAPALVVYDSRIPRSVAFARSIAAERLDLASQDAKHWRALRQDLPPGRVVGLTRWSDYVLVRGFAEEQRKRLKSERRVGSLMVWEMG